MADFIPIAIANTDVAPKTLSMFVDIRKNTNSGQGGNYGCIPMGSVETHIKMFLQRTFDTTLNSYVYYASDTIIINPPAHLTTPVNSGTFDSSRHEIVSVYLKDVKP